MNFGLQLENNDNLCYKLRLAVFRTDYKTNANKDCDNNDRLKNIKVMTKMTIGRKQEGAEEQKSGIDDVSCHYPEESQTHRHNHHYHHQLRQR